MLTVPNVSAAGTVVTKISVQRVGNTNELSAADVSPVN